MIFSIKGLVILASILVLFGGAMYDLTTTAGRCGLALTSPQAGYSCDEFWGTIGKTIILPDQNIGKGVTGILNIREVEQSALDELGIIPDIQESQFRNQIILGIVGIGVLFLFLSYVFIKLSPSSGIDAGSLGVSILAAFLVLTALMVMFDDGPEPGFMEIPGANTPFKGLRSLMAHPEVLRDVVDETSVLPGTLTTDDIFEGES